MASGTRTSFDVVVVGTGPAGAVAAFHLARAGVRVALVDKAAPPRYKTCGGGVVGRARGWLPVDITPAVTRACHQIDVNLSGVASVVSCRRAAPIVSMTMRAQLDHLLVAAAVDAGAVLLAPLEIHGLAVDGRCVLTTPKGTLDAGLVIAADGATGSLARAAGWPPNRGAVPAVEWEVTVPGDTLERFGAAARFDYGLIPHGYGWVFPKGDHLSIGVLTTRRGHGGLHAMVEAYLRHLAIRPLDAAERHGYVIPMRPVVGGFVRNRTILVGDAAGFVDPVTAEGISFAALSGQLAARSIERGGLDEVRVRRSYHAALRRKILPELRAGRVFARLLYGHPRIRGVAYRARGQVLGEAVTGVFMGEQRFRDAFRSPLPALRLIARGATGGNGGR